MGSYPGRSPGDGSLANCQHLGTVFVDIDFKDTPEATARERLATCPCPPSIIVHSGDGLHCYWLLREPFNLATEADQAKRLLRRLLAEAFVRDYLAEKRRYAKW